jgi:hypothetical protein
MKNKILPVFAAMLVFSVLLSSPQSASAGVRQEGGMFIVDDAEGYAPIKNGNKNAAREEAKREAYRDALEKALGAVVTGVTEMENYAVVRDKVFSQSTGIVKAFDITREWEDDDGVFYLTAICKVGVTALDGVLGPAVIDAIGNPRIMILIDERVGDKKPHISFTEGETLRIFEKAGYLIVDPDQARALMSIDPASAYDDPAKLMDAARTLRADVIILGKAYSSAFQSGKVEGITMYGMKGTVQLKAVLTKSAYQISSKTVEQSTGKTPALSMETGANRCFKAAAAIAANEIVHKIAYSLISGSAGGIPGVTVNIKISDISFKEVEAIEEALRELAGKSGSVYEREYKDGILEVDVVSEKTARDIASFLSERGIEIEGVTAQTISAKNSAVSKEAEKSEGKTQEESKKSGGVCGTGVFGIAGLVFAWFVCLASRRFTRE